MSCPRWRSAAALGRIVACGVPQGYHLSRMTGVGEARTDMARGPGRGPGRGEDLPPLPTKGMGVVKERDS